MGYELHITRKTEWSDEGNDISLGEWNEYVSNDQEMRMDNYAEAKGGGGAVIRLEEEGLAVWLGYSGHIEGVNMVWFSYSNGNISVKNPNDEIINKMISVANALSAKVQGDDGEYYPLQNGQVVQGHDSQNVAAGVMSDGILALVFVLLVVVWALKKMMAN